MKYINVQVHVKGGAAVFLDKKYCSIYIPQLQRVLLILRVYDLH